MKILMLETVVKPTPRGMFVANRDDLVEVTDDLGAELIEGGKAAEATFDAGTGQDNEPAAVKTPAPAAAKVAAAKPEKKKPGRKPAEKPAAVEPVTPAPVSGDEAPAA